MTKEYIIVSRHKYFVDFAKEMLKKKGISNVQVLDTVTPEDLKGKIVVTSGLPISFLKNAEEVILLEIKLPRDVKERAKIIESLETGKIKYNDLDYSIEHVKVIDLKRDKKIKEF
ncbi:MAG TPA: hypothetical protein EYH54_05930 [Nautiliaceae bacterium]|nr:hypothetical protein [Nautiliaceae bacterium]